LGSHLTHFLDIRHWLEFEVVLQCFLLLLKRTGKQFWVGEGPEFPQVVFDSIKENKFFLELLQNIHSSQERPWFLAWFSEYLHTIRDLPAYGEVLARGIDFLCEETQHERFQSVRPSTMISGTRVSLFWFEYSGASSHETTGFEYSAPTMSI